MALIRNIEELRRHLPVAYASNLSVLPGFDDAEVDYLVPILGDDLYHELTAAYTGGTMSAIQQQLLLMARGITAPFAFAANLPFIQTLITNNGIVALETDHSRKAFKWEYNNVVKALEKNGYAAQERLILFLLANRVSLPSWSSSRYLSDNRVALIRNGADLASVHTLLQPHRCYLLIKPLIDTVVLMHLKKLPFYDAFNARLLAGTTTPQDVELANLLRPMLARRVMEYAAIELSIEFTGAAFTILDGTYKDSPDDGRKAAGMDAIKAHREQMAQTATFFLQEALDFLNRTASPAVFPEYYNSDLYPKSNINTGSRSTGLKGVFIAG